MKRTGNEKFVQNRDYTKVNNFTQIMSVSLVKDPTDELKRPKNRSALHETHKGSKVENDKLLPEEKASLGLASYYSVAANLCML